MKVAIIGCGYVGSQVARLWHAAGDKVTVTTTTPDKQEQLQEIAAKVVILTGDNLANFRKLVQEQDVILLSVAPKQRGGETYAKTYLETAENLVKAIDSRSQLKQLIYTSSYGIINDMSGDVVDETVVINPVSDKSKILYQTEQVLISASTPQLKTCILRLSGIYGKGRELIKIFHKRAGTTQLGTGDNYTNWVHLEDIVRAIAFARQQQLDGIYNVNSDQILTSKDFFAQLFQAHNLPGITWDSTQTASRSLNLKLSNQKIKAAGFKFQHPLIEFI